MEEDKTYFDDNKELIDPQIHTCLYFLIKYLFLGEQSMRESSIKKLKDFIKRINLDIKLNKNATNIENMNKIFNYIKTQNNLLASEILENIMIVGLHEYYLVIVGKHIKILPILLKLRKRWMS